METKDELDEDTTTSVEVELELISKPEVTLNSSIDENIISLHHSFGYDCKKMYNLVLMDNETLVFASGNLIHFFNVTLSTVTTRRSAGGGGIGCIAKNPNRAYNHLTIGENGKKPTIYIYKFPEMELIAMLKRGTKRQYSILDYTVDGELLASQGGDPDYTITIWDWKRKEIKLRAKSFSNDVVNLMFSPYIPEQLTTCGLGHIKFWKMSSTFTGLKLQGLIGRFGKTEICDIYGICPLPDEKILSGCEWGNVLVWDDGLIKLEVCRKNRRPCHQGAITQIFMRNAEEIVTVGTDGFICIWFWETVELSDPPEDDRFVEIEPSHEFRVGLHNYNAELLKIIKIDSDDTDWYAQDGLGGIWWCDLATEVRPQLPRQLFRCHAGEIVALDTSSVSQHIATFGRDGRLYGYDYEEKKMIFHHQFIASGCDFIWLPVTLDPSGAVMVLGFTDGVIRVITFNYKLQDLENAPLQLVQVIKCHCKPITKISINPKGSILVSASEDSTIFIHQLVKGSPIISLQPIGFISMPSPVTFITWMPSKWSTIVAGCKLGDVVQADLPEQPTASTETSYQLKQIPLSHFKFKSIKSHVRRNEKIKQIEIRKEQKRQRKIKSLEKKMIENPKIEIDEEAFLADSEDEEILEPIFTPNPPNSILWIQVTSDNTLWLSVGGYDAGYIYEYSVEGGELLSYTLIPEADDIEIATFTYFGEYLIFGMADGKLRINHVKSNWRDLTDFWLLGMHDNFFGKIPAIKFSFDSKFLFSVGADGNLFSYTWNLPLKESRSILLTTVPRLISPVYDIDDPNFLSLEQQKEKENDEKRREISTENKNKVLKMIEDLRAEFDEIMKTNALLPQSQKLTTKDLELDERISDDLQQELDIQMDIVRRKKAFDYEKVKLAGKKLKEYFIDPVDFPIQVIGINNLTTVYSFRIKKLGNDFYLLKHEMELKMRQASKKKRMMDMVDASIKTVETESSMPVVESFLIGLSPVVIETKLESKMRRLLNKYRERKSQEMARKKEWMTVNAEKPDPEHDHPLDKKLIEEAQQTIGNYKLKADPNFEAEDEERETVAKKLEELIKTRQDVYNIRNEYNQKILALRGKKKNLILYIQRKLEKLDEIHLEIPEGQRMKPKTDVTFDYDREFPEKNLDLKRYLTPGNYERDLLSNGNEIEAKLARELTEKHLANIQRSVLRDNITMPGVVNKSASLSRKVYERVQAAAKHDSDWEIELKALRTRRRLFEQEKIINKIDERIAEFDEEIEKLSDDRYEVEVKAKFKELYLLTLNHELMILRDFETTEENLADFVDSKDSERKHLSTRIVQTKSDIEGAQKVIGDLYEAKSEIELRFKSNCMGNKFSPFLRKIFKKKIHFEDDNEENNDDDNEKDESDYSSSAGSLEEGYSDLKHLSEDECPKGCDRNLYNLTFELRQERLELEMSIRTRENDIESLQMEVETMTLRQEKAEEDYASSKAKLTELRRKKQQMLNEVNIVVCLKMDQMQYFRNQSEFECIDNTLLFNNHNVTKLYSRVGKLALETIEAKRKHRINVIHLAKMKTDIKFMEKQITDLKDETSQAMLKKFGRVIDLNEVEETILRRFAFEMQVEMRANAEDIKRQYFNKINELKKAKIAKEEMLNRVIQEATEKLNILTVLEEEKNFLHRIIAMQGRKKEFKAAGLPYREIDNDLSKLKEISNHQKEQIEMLQREIRALTLKSKSFVNARQEFESLNYSITQLRGECRFEDSICSNPDESMLSSTRATTPDHEAFNEILKTVKKFAESNFSDQLEVVEVENISLNLAKYLMNVSVNLPSAELEDILPEAISYLGNFLPKHVLVAPETIAELVANIIGNFDNVNEVNRLEVLKEIINNTIESANQTAITSDSYLQHIITEIFKQMVITMRFNDVTSSDCSTTIIERLSKLNALQTSSVNINAVIDEILEYANDNMEDGVDGQVLKKVVSNIITKLTA